MECVFKDPVRRCTGVALVNLWVWLKRKRRCDECSASSVIRGPVLVGLDFFVPGVGTLQGLIDVVDVFYTGGVEPILEGLGALLGVNGDAVLPGGAAAEDAVEAGAGFDGELEGFDKDWVGDAS